MEQYDELFMLMYAYLHRHKSIEGYVNLTIKDFILYHNFIPNRNKGRINDKVYSTLQLMIDKGFIEYIGCYSNGGLTLLDDVDCNMMFTVQLINLDDKWNPLGQFTKLLYSEIDTLRSSNTKNMDKVLYLYMNIKKNISADVDAGSARPFTFPSEETLAKECGCSVGTVKKNTEILCGLKMLYVVNYGSYLRMRKGKEITVNSNNVYALEEKYINKSTKEAFIKELQIYYGFIDGFYPPTNNLSGVSKNKDKIFGVDSDQWGEPDAMHDFSEEEMLEIPTLDEVQSEDIDADLLDIDNLYETDESLMELY
ncbi:MAG: hypothetical protein IJN54_01935 [Lachnospiraceae bacterium]|nr:hypothetical protein [Lachnospiraceae bacterium]